MFKARIVIDGRQVGKSESVESQAHADQLAKVEAKSHSYKNPRKWVFIETFNSLIQDWVPHSSVQSNL